MLVAVTLTVTVTALLLAAWCGLDAYRDRPTDDWHFVGMAVVTLAALVQLVVALVRMGHGDRPDDGVPVFVGYLVGAVLTVPVAAFMSLAERSRWGTAVVAAGGVILAVLELRLHDIWGAGHG